MDNVKPPTGIDKREVRCLKCGQNFWLHIEHICMTTPTNTPTPRTDAIIEALGHASRKTDGMCLSEVTDFARTLERENQQLQREIGEAVSRGKLEALKYTQEERERFGRWCAQNNDFLEIKEQRDHFKHLAEERWKVCEELAEKLKLCKECTPIGYVANPHGEINHSHYDLHSIIDNVLSLYHSLQQQKKDEC